MDAVPNFLEIMFMFDVVGFLETFLFARKQLPSFENTAANVKKQSVCEGGKREIKNGYASCVNEKKIDSYTRQIFESIM